VYLALVIRYMAHWSTELTHILFFVTTILFLGILEVGHMDGTVIFSYHEHGIEFNVTIYHLLLATIAIMLVAIGWMEYKREQLEEIIRELLEKRE